MASEAATSGPYDSILVEAAAPVATITLNRPKVLNALDRATIAEVTRAFAELGADAGIRAIVVTGAGDRAFAAGADIAELATLDDPIRGAALARVGQALTLAIERARPVVIAAVNGFALGGGCELAMACDIRIASEKARFGQPEVNLGLLPGYGGTQRITRLAGRGAAMLLCTAAEPIDAAEALRIGLVDRVVPAERLLAEAHRVASLIAAKAPLAIAATKASIRDGAALPLAAGLEIEALHFGTLVATRDFSEGTRAFLEKRPPAFSGS